MSIQDDLAPCPRWPRPRHDQDDTYLTSEVARLTVVPFWFGRPSSSVGRWQGCQPLLSTSSVVPSDMASDAPEMPSAADKPQGASGLRKYSKALYDFTRPHTMRGQSFRRGPGDSDRSPRQSLRDLSCLPSSVASAPLLALLRDSFFLVETFELNQ